jgi:hypothetical protein
MVVQTDATHNYQAGMNVAFLIPTRFGMQELNDLNGYVLSVTSDTMSISIDSTNFSSFSYPSPLPSAYTPPSVFANAEGPQIPGALPYGNQESFDGCIYNAGQI